MEGLDGVSISARFRLANEEMVDVIAFSIKLKAIMKNRSMVKT